LVSVAEVSTPPANTATYECTEKKIFEIVKLQGSEVHLKKLK
jgi:hypothetical protein